MHKNINIFLIIIFSLLLSQPLELLEQKKDLEIYYRDKILFLLTGNVLDKSQFTVDVYVKLNSTHTKEKDAFNNKKILEKTTETNTGSNSNSLDFLLGTPITPSTDRPAASSDVTEKMNVPSNNIDEFDISRIDVIVYLDDFVSTGSVKTNVEKIIRNVLPRKFASCEDCIRINSLNMNNQNHTENKGSTPSKTVFNKPDKGGASTYNNKIKDDINDIKTTLNGLLKNSSTGKTNTNSEETNTYLKKLKEQIAYYDSLEANREDSLRAANKRLATEYEKLRDKQSREKDSLLTQTTAQLMDAQDDKDTLNHNWRKAETVKEDRNHKFSEKVVYISLGVASAIILILLLAFIFKKNQKVETVYLKPKGSTKKKSKKDDTKNNVKDSNAKEESEPDESASPQAGAAPPTEVPQKQGAAASAVPTQAFEDPNVLKSEVGTLRQSAISMTVGQKEAANKIIADWLEDAPKDGAEGEEGEGEGEE